MSSNEFNYEVFNKEKLAVVYALEKWRHFLQGSESKTMIFRDHHNLSYCTEKVKLHHRQAHCAEILQELSFLIVYLKVSQNVKADILSKCPAYAMGG